MEATSVNKREAMNHIRRFGNRFDRFRNAGGAGGSGGRNASKRPKAGAESGFPQEQRIQ